MHYNQRGLENNFSFIKADLCNTVQYLRRHRRHDRHRQRLEYGPLPRFTALMSFSVWLMVRQQLDSPVVEELRSRSQTPRGRTIVSHIGVPTDSRSTRILLRSGVALLVRTAVLAGILAHTHTCLQRQASDLAQLNHPSLFQGFSW